MRYSLYIGRFQPFHEGHKWCIQTMLSNGKKVCIAIMDINETEPENNPYTFEQVSNMIKKEMSNEIQIGLLKIVKLPPIESVNYGRDVGYDLIEHVPPKKIKEISATKIRNKNFDQINEKK